MKGTHYEANRKEVQEILRVIWSITLFAIFGMTVAKYDII
jgi:hypothetical protein